MTREDLTEEIIKNINFIAGDQNLSCVNETISMVKKLEMLVRAQFQSLEESLDYLRSSNSETQLEERYSELYYQLNEFINDRSDFSLEEEDGNNEKN